MFLQTCAQDQEPQESAVTTALGILTPSVLGFAKNRTDVARVHYSHGGDTARTGKNDPCPLPDCRTLERQTPSGYVKAGKAR